MLSRIFEGFQKSSNQKWSKEIGLLSTKLYLPTNFNHIGKNSFYFYSFSTSGSVFLTVFSLVWHCYSFHCLFFFFALDDHSCYFKRGRPPLHHQLIYLAALSRLHVGRNVPGRFPHDSWFTGELLHWPRRNTFQVHPKLPADVWTHSPFGLYGNRTPEKGGRFLPDWASDPVPKRPQAAVPTRHLWRSRGTL